MLPFWRRFSRMVGSIISKQVHGDYSQANLTKVFEAWNNSIIAECPKDKLLVFDVKEGWEPLCKFLGKPVPNLSFPHVNDTKEFQRIMTVMNIFGYVIASAGVAAVAVGIKLAMKML